jgi:hypothetical protein
MAQQAPQKCQGCEKPLAPGQPCFGVHVTEPDVRCQGCKTPWTVSDLLYCSRKCFDKHCYWQMTGDNSIGVEDECGGCGIALVDDIEVRTFNKVPAAGAQ